MGQYHFQRRERWAQRPWRLQIQHLFALTGVRLSSSHSQVQITKEEVWAGAQWADDSHHRRHQFSEVSLGRKSDSYVPGALNFKIHNKVPKHCFVAKDYFSLLISLQSILKFAARQITLPCFVIWWTPQLHQLSQWNDIYSCHTVQLNLHMKKLHFFPQKSNFVTFVILCDTKLWSDTRCVFPLFLHLDSGLNQRTSRGSHCSFTTKLWKKR